MKKILVVGSLNMDYSIKTSKMPNVGETVLGKEYTLNPGGKGANCAYALGRFGANISMLGMVGLDENGKILKNNLKEVNVNDKNIKEINDSTGVAFVTVDDDGDNSIIVISGANSKVDKSFIDENISLIKDSDIIVMQLEIPIDTVLYVSKLAKEYGKTVILDPAPARNDLPLELYKNIDIIKPNETEVLTLTGKDDIGNASLDLIEKGCKNVIVTLGSEGSLLVTKDGMKKYDAEKVDVVDTTAAGDTFTGALAFALSNDKELDEAIKFANKVSSIVVTRKGAQESIPSYEEVKELL